MKWQHTDYNVVIIPQHSWGSAMSNWTNWVGDWLGCSLGDYL